MAFPGTQEVNDRRFRALVAPTYDCGVVAFASGIAAQAALFTSLSPGDHVVSSSALYGGTVNQFKHLLSKMSVALTWVGVHRP